MDYQKYENCEYNYYGKLYRFVGEKINFKEEPEVILLQNVNGDTHLLVLKRDFKRFHNEYVIK